MTALPHGLRAHLLMAVIAVTATTLTILASTRMSTTFDEIAAVAGGSRALGAGSLEMMPDYPPVTQYLYGLPLRLAGVRHPDEATGSIPHRYEYAQRLFWRSGNDPEKVALLARCVAALFALTLVVLTYAFTTRHYGAGAGLLAGTLVAFMPDVLAHGGVAYNDIALAPAFLAALWALDSAVRRPTPGRGAVAGLLTSLAVGVKHSALTLGPIAILLVLVELAARARTSSQEEPGRITGWLRGLALAVFTAAAVGYVAQALLYGGDFTLAYLRASTVAASGHISGGHGVPAYLLGREGQEAWWYFYPVAFLFKTPAALHVLIVIALIGGVSATRTLEWRTLLRSRLRALLIAFLVFAAVLLRANLVIGFRYALPLLPIIAILTAVGCTLLWRRSGRLVHGVIAALTVWFVGSALSFYPHFLTYTSEYRAAPDEGYRVFVDSSLDWGQGLLELRDFMREESIGTIYLSYFGSALPEGYGIDYVPLPSFFPLAPLRPLASRSAHPRFAAISATNLVGLYFTGDPYAELRQREPYRVLGNAIFIYEVAP